MFLGCKNQSSSPKATIFERLWQRASQLNFFQTVASITDDRVRRDQILSTRVYLILVGLLLQGIILFITLSETKRTITIPNPSLTTYEKFQKLENSLVCPCSSISIPYANIASLSPPILHQVCSSSFVGQKWISAAFGSTTATRSRIRAVLSAHFRLLAAFCRLSQQILDDAQKKFLSRNLISVTLLSRPQFIEQLDFTIIELYKQAPTIFRRPLALILDTFLGNQVISIYETNWHLVYTERRLITASPRSYGEYL
jgi:hypothetical protein